METRWSLAIALISSLALGCSGAAPDPRVAGDVVVAPDGGAPTPGPMGTFTGECCINGAFYACATQEAFDACSGASTHACFEACEPGDFGCFERCSQLASSSSPDPSQCTRTEARDGECTTTSTPSSRCSRSGSSLGRCASDSDCSSVSHCHGGECYLDSSGSPCTSSSQCGSVGHCFNGCCYLNSMGEPCTVPSDCSSGRCAGGRCN